MKTAILLTIILGLGLSSAFAQEQAGDGNEAGKEWQIVDIDGLDFVTVGNVESFYRFDSLEKKNGVAVLRTRTMLLSLDFSRQMITINGVPVAACLEMRNEDNGRMLISTIDLAKTIEPAFRPSYIKGADGAFASVETIYSGADAMLERLGLEEGKTRSDPGGQAPTATMLVELTESKDQRIHLRTELLAPAGVGVDGDVSGESKSVPGNKFDTASMAFATAINASLAHRLRTVVDVNNEGIFRSRDEPFLASTRPTIRVFVELPADVSDRVELEVLLDWAIQGLRRAVGK